MNFATLLTVAALAAPPASDPVGRKASGPVDPDLVQIGGFVLDTSALATRPEPVIPEIRLRPQDLSIGALVNRLIQEPGGFQIVETIEQRQYIESEDWFLERDASRGTALALRKPTDDIVAVPQNESALKFAARQRLAQLGIRSQEIEKIMQRRLMGVDEQDGQLGEPELHRYKTFVMRGLNGVEVEGHRAVVTHHLDGSFQKAWIQWPALAEAGHRLRTDLADPALPMAAFVALIEAGEVEGVVELRWKYVPRLLQDGTVELELMLGARLEHEDQGDDLIGHEPREFNVLVSAY